MWYSATQMKMPNVIISKHIMFEPHCTYREREHICASYYRQKACPNERGMEWVSGERRWDASSDASSIKGDTIRNSKFPSFCSQILNLQEAQPVTLEFIYFGTVLEPFWNCSGTVLELFWNWNLWNISAPFQDLVKWSVIDNCDITEVKIISNICEE